MRNANEAKFKKKNILEKKKIIEGENELSKVFLMKGQAINQPKPIVNFSYEN